jgi:hypothetical protein
LCCFNKFINHGSRRGNTAQALVRWRHPVAFSEALDVLYRAMRKIASDSPSFLLSPISLMPTTVAK